MTVHYRAAKNKKADSLSLWTEDLLSSRRFCSATTTTMDRLLKAQDTNTEQHSFRSQEIAVQLAFNIGLPESCVDSIRLLGRFHDIGKIGIPDSLLLKAEPLTTEEFQFITKHSEIGYHIALSLPEITHIAELILKHHERWDGAGYPLKHKEEQIPIECRIMAIVDAYDSMTNDRPYRKAISHDEAIEELQRCAGSQFDPVLSQKFVELTMLK